MPTFPLQDHIHLAATLGGAPEFAPVYTWTTSDRVESPKVIMSMTRSLTGKLRKHVLKSGAQPVQFANYRYVVRLGRNTDEAQEKAALLKSLYAQTVYFCDHYHPDDGTSHSSAVKTMFVAYVGDLKVFNPSLIRYYVELLLEDDNTVT